MAQVDLHTELTVLSGLALRIMKLQKELQDRLSVAAKKVWEDEHPENS